MSIIVLAGNDWIIDGQLAARIVGSALLILLAIIGYFIRMKHTSDTKDRVAEREDISKKINILSGQQKESVDKLSTVVETVSETVNNLKIIVEVIKRQQSEDLPRAENRLNAHSSKIAELDVRVASLETKCNYNHR